MKAADEAGRLEMRHRVSGLVKRAPQTGSCHGWRPGRPTAHRSLKSRHQNPCGGRPGCGGDQQAKSVEKHGDGGAVRLDVGLRTGPFMVGGTPQGCGRPAWFCAAARAVGAAGAPHGAGPRPLDPTACFWSCAARTMATHAPPPPAPASVLGLQPLEDLQWIASGSAAACRVSRSLAPGRSL